VFKRTHQAVKATTICRNIIRGELEVALQNARLLGVSRSMRTAVARLRGADGTRQKLAEQAASADIMNAREATRNTRSGTRQHIRIVYSSLITSRAANNSRKIPRVCSRIRLLRTFYWSFGVRNIDRALRLRPHAVRKPKPYEVSEPGDLVEVETVDI